MSWAGPVWLPGCLWAPVCPRALGQVFAHLPSALGVGQLPSQLRCPALAGKASSFPQSLLPPGHQQLASLLIAALLLVLQSEFPPLTCPLPRPGPPSLRHPLRRLSLFPGLGPLLCLGVCETWGAL